MIAVRAILVFAFALTAFIPSATAAPSDEGVLHVLPLYAKYLNATDDEYAAEVQALRGRFVEGGPVRVGFSLYINVLMEKWNITTEAEAAANLSTTVLQIDRAIARARAHNLPIALLLNTAVRESVDAAQAASQDEDRRVMQWFDNNSMATGWWTYSRYARKQATVRELYLRILARVIANRVARYPETIVGVAGDGEIELAEPGSTRRADFSPFAIAEFRDWLRGDGLYAPGQLYAPDAYEHAVRYRGDASPSEDTNHDGHTLNSDFQPPLAFTTWRLRHFDWSLNDQIDDDRRAIPVSTYSAESFQPLPSEFPTGFDAPRDASNRDWSQLWFKFREQLVSHYTIDFARVLTTTPDPITGLTLAPSRFFSYQIPADYLFGHTPAHPNERYLSSASSWKSADVRPFGGAGVTAFNTFESGTYYRTLANVAPLLVPLGTRWAIFEWNPSVPSTVDRGIYVEDTQIVERGRPHIVVPFAWDDGFYRVRGSGFESALTQMIDRLRAAPWRLQATANGNRVKITWAPPDTGSAVDSYVLEVGSTWGTSNLFVFNTGSRSTIFEASAPPGTYYLRVRARHGGETSIASNEAKLVVGEAGVPRAPVGLSAVVSGSTMAFNWITPMEGPSPTGYVIEASSEQGSSPLATLRVAPASTFTISAVPFGSYYVRVRAENSAGVSAPSNEVLVTSGPGDGLCTPPDGPGPLAFRFTGSLVTFEWDAPTRGATPTGYQLEAGSTAGATDIGVIPLGTARSFTAAVPAGTYYLQMRTLGLCGQSAASPAIRLVVP